MKNVKKSNVAKKNSHRGFSPQKAEVSPILDTAGGEMPDADAPRTQSRQDAQRAFSK